MSTPSKRLFGFAAVVFGILVSATAVAHTDGIYNPTANSVGDTQGIDSNAATGAVAFVGPGDVVASAKVWWGLRAYSLAKTGTKAVRLVRASDTTQSDINTLANGKLDTATASTFCNATTCKVVSLYDQSGANSCAGTVPCDLTQATDANRPAFTFNCIGVLPCITFTGTPMQLATAVSNAATIIQPFTISQVSERNASFTTQQEVINSGNCTGTFYPTSTNAIGMYAQTGVSTATASDSAFHATSFVFNAASSTINVDNSSSTPGTPGTDSFANAAPINMGHSTCNFFNGLITEGGVWTGGFTGGQQTSMNSNQHSYWGF